MSGTDRSWVSSLGPAQHWTTGSVWEAELAGMDVVGTRPPLGRYLAELWAFRSFTWADARARLASWWRGGLCAGAWLAARPALETALVVGLFGVVLQMSRYVDGFTGFVLVGATVFAPLGRALTLGAEVVPQDRDRLRAHPFPRACLPLSMALAQLLGSLPSLLVMVVGVAVLVPGAHPGPVGLLAVPVLALEGLLVVGVTACAARLGALHRGASAVLPLVAAAWWAASGVFFSYERFIESSVLLDVVSANPAYLAARMVRGCLLDGVAPSTRMWAALVAWALVVGCGGLVWFWLKEADYGHER